MTANLSVHHLKKHNRRCSMPDCRRYFPNQHPPASSYGIIRKPLSCARLEVDV